MNVSTAPKGTIFMLIRDLFKHACAVLPEDSSCAIRTKGEVVLVSNSCSILVNKKHI